MISFAILIWFSVKFIMAAADQGDRGAPAEDRRRPGRRRQSQQEEPRAGRRQGRRRTEALPAPRRQRDHRTGPSQREPDASDRRGQGRCDRRRCNRQKAAGRSRDRGRRQPCQGRPAQAGVLCSPSPVPRSCSSREINANDAEGADRRTGRRSSEANEAKTMSQALTLARPYARAAFAVAREQAGALAAAGPPLLALQPPWPSPSRAVQVAVLLDNPRS